MKLFGRSHNCLHRRLAGWLQVALAAVAANRGQLLFARAGNIDHRGRGRGQGRFIALAAFWHGRGPQGVVRLAGCDRSTCPGNVCTVAAQKAVLTIWLIATWSGCPEMPSGPKVMTTSG